MRVEVEAFSDDAIAFKDAIQTGPNYKPGGATFAAGKKTPIGARLVTYLLGLWLRLECSLDCISGPVGYQQNIFILSLSAFLLKLKKCNYKKCNWVCGSPSILYKLVLGPVPIVHTNFQENLLMSYSWCPQLSR